MITFVIEILKALLTGEIKNWLAERREKKAQDAVNKDSALSDSTVVEQLHKWQKPN